MDSKRMFIIAFDAFDPSVDMANARTLLKTSPVFAGWWHHIPGCLLVSSDQDADRITDEIRTVTGKARLLVIEVNPLQSEGWLPKASWDWIRRREGEHAPQETEHHAQAH